ncbi:MAG TPA: hypothetical protein VFG42_26590 [Baekduia sp.]|uniref:hypothetical protein n=1 Tax=Baekduia sp. TaxID=2600305 RepID=UPI002D773AFF|nr:hypothetical protein [Baekduia sp.]HET6510391.1 hypothetical protein [Baekduia sp.]
MAPKILTLDRYLEDTRVENLTYSDDRTILQHDIVIWDPEEILDNYSQSSRYRNAPCLTDNASVAYLADRRRRSQEFRDFLALSKLLVIFTPQSFGWYYATGETRNEGTPAKPRLKRIVAESRSDGVLPVDLELVPGSGDEFRLVAGPPFSSFWRAVGDQFYFNSYFKQATGETLLSMAGTDRPVGAKVEMSGGTVLLLPQLGSAQPNANEFDRNAPDFSERWAAKQAELDALHHGKFIDALVELHKALGASDGNALPNWAADYVLPGEPEAVALTIEAQEKVAEAQQELEESHASLARLQQQKILIAGTGKDLERAVHEALVELGCQVEEGEPGRTDRVLKWRDRIAVIEVKGLTKSAKEADAAQLEKWVSSYIESHDERPKGILVTNGWRETPLAKRTQPTFPNQMLKYATAREHCLVEASQLLVAALTCTTSRAKNAFVRSLFDTNGVLPGYGWETALTRLQPQETEAGPTV